MSHSTPQFKRLAVLAAALAPIALLTGCSMTGTAPATNSFSPTATISGSLHGGNQPIAGASVSLYGAGNTGYGSAPTLFATTTSNNDASGSFSFNQVALPVGNTTGIINTGGNTYACPASNPQIYIVSTGGSTEGSGNPSNPAARFILAIGQCSNASSVFADLNEVTTVATLAALQQYYNPNSEGLGYNGTTQSALGFSNGVATIANLVNTQSGTANTTFTPASTLSGATVTATPETAKINTIANILAACVNSNSSILGTSTSCQTLFNNAVPPASAAQTSQPDLTFSSATDTLGAAYFMLINPTNNQDPTGKGANLFALGGGVGAPFQPSLSTQPTDWTIGVTYGSTSQPNGTNFLLTDPEHVAVDAQGNVWFENFGSTGVNTGNSITELSPTGGAMAQALTGIGGTSHNLAIDTGGNVWVPISYPLTSPFTSGLGNTVYEYTAGGGTNTFTTGNDPSSIAFDGQGNAFVLEPSFKNTLTASGAASVGTIEEIPVGSTSTTVPTTIATNLDTDFSALTLDSNYTIWVTGGGTSTTPTPAGGLAGIYEFLKNTGTGTGYPTTPSATATAANAPSVTEPETGLAINGNGDVLSANFGKSTIGGVAGTSTTTIAAAPNTPLTTTGLTAPQIMVVDGAGNLWSGQASSTGNVYAFSATGAALSPTGGFVHTYKEPYGIAVDPSGNVWVANENATASTTAAGFVTEIVGAAVPVVTPIAAGLPTTAGGANKLGTKP